MSTGDFLFRGELGELDPDVAELVRHETARQARYLIMIPSESTVPEAVREAVGSAFHNIYAEGYPSENMRHMSQSDILDYEQRLPEYRRFSDARYYKGTEYANMIESLARRRTAEAFANDRVSADGLYVNVQPLSGAPANNAVYTALLQPGDKIMSMDLMIGGHLSHGAPVNRSGKFFEIIPYGINPETEEIDYDTMWKLALEHKPRILIGGFSSYPLQPDWNKYREIADACGAILLADVAHVAGMIAAGAYTSPVGIADIMTFTTHKTLNGPRGAVIITHRKDLSAKIDRGVFPGEQGGPHVNNIAGLAVAMRLARSQQFHDLQHQTVKNARRMADRLQSHGLHLPYGGTDTHLMVVDCSSIVGPDGTTLSGDMAARILDMAGIVCNRQTIPGDSSALRPSGVRLGTPWITQRGFKDAEIDQLSDIIAGILKACVPFSLTGRLRPESRAKIDFDTFQSYRMQVRDLAASVGIDTNATQDGYPHTYFLDDLGAEVSMIAAAVSGDNASAFLQAVLTSDVLALADGESQPTHVLEADGSVMASGTVVKAGPERYVLHLSGKVNRALTWMRALSDGFTIFDPTDVHAKVPGPVMVNVVDSLDAARTRIAAEEGYASKVYHVGINGPHYSGPTADSLPEFSYESSASGDALSTPLTQWHQQQGARMGEFAGYSMPLWYSSVADEHRAVRSSAGLFDVTHMGVFEVRGAGAEAFLDALTTNDVPRLKVGSSHYTFLLDVHGQPIDDLLIYRLAADHFMVVVNASNNDENWAWLNAVKNGQVSIDAAHPARRLSGAADLVLRDLRSAASGADQRVDIALQGPNSRDLLLALGGDTADLARVKSLQWAQITTATLGGFDLLVSRTGYTGERVAYEIFPHPDQAEALFQKLVDLGATPCGLAARDSLRIEAGLPLYGHELAGPLALNPADAGMSNYVKLYKSFFVGKQAFIQHGLERDAQIVRFQIDAKGARPAHQGDPVIDSRGRVVGLVTSCATDADGHQIGQAYVSLSHSKRGTQLAVYAGSSRAKVSDLANLSMGDRAPMPELITVLTRFPKNRK